MSIHNTIGVRVLGAAIAAALGMGFASTGPADAVPPANPPPSASVANGTLNVTGTPGADHIALRLAAGNTNTLEIDFNDDGVADQSFDRSTFTAISVLLGNGDDSFRIDQVNGAFADEALTVDGGSGNDTIIGGDGNDVLIGGSGNDNTFGKHGVDTALLGSGNDQFTWDPGDANDTIEGGTGTDNLVFNGASGNENMTLSANGTRTRFVRDLGNIVMDMGGVETLDVNALGGADTVTINDTSGTGFKQANVDLSVSGAADGAADLVTVNGTPGAEKINVDAAHGAVDVKGFSAQTHITGSETGSLTGDQLQVNGRGGRDSAEVKPGVNSLIGVDVKLA